MWPTNKDSAIISEVIKNHFSATKWCLGATNILSQDDAALLLFSKIDNWFERAAPSCDSRI
ncbi:MAG TPA: hypothetical protein VK558_07065, partial [Patescibacteria group bacterium]|nr:hypothetical protein [Patescibacteria group bacterium]